MTRWLIPPLIGALLLTGSGFLRSLENTTDRSVELAVSSEDAPRSTGSAAEEVAPLPVLADVTTTQAQAFEQLAKALDLSAQRVFALNDSLARQSDGIEAMTSELASFDDPLDCAQTNLTRLTAQSRTVPSGIRTVEGILERIIASQDKAVRHLKSINRKLAALGIVATVSGEEAPPPPETDRPAPVEPVQTSGSCP
jgi:hypothetical protein